MTDADIRDDAGRHRYELPVGDQVAVVVYNLSGQNLMITETLVPVALEGQGIASRLAKHVIANARARGLLILPVCPFFSAYLQKHPEHADVVHPTYRDILGLQGPR
ncbi:GNAT family N-acetyltransferase [Brevundimonas sp.]|uniref:GNAT family N-acetyltransferase n=1 Tax=Brevundimonas sp. TaxID=1871086 RepID=UPI002D7289BB|nr:GNAT family N-acetyltransferase [Brevundimonas sp.]HYC73252.1 GNAT family N-acetyltransferase [Brevundimonas sp.]